MTKNQLIDVSERVLWTLVQGASAVGILAGLNSTLHVNLDLLVWTPILTAILSLIKSALATKFGDGTAATVSASPTQETDTAAGLPDRSAALTDASGDADGTETPAVEIGSDEDALAAKVAEAVATALAQPARAAAPETTPAATAVTPAGA